MRRKDSTHLTKTPTISKPDESPIAGSSASKPVSLKNETSNNTDR